MVERLLPGGLDVVGFYLLCPSAAFAGGAGAVSYLAEAAGKEGLAAGLPSLLLLHMDSVSGAMALRELPAGLRGAAPRPAELRTAPVLDQLVTVTSRYPLQLDLPVASGKQELQAAFQAAVDAAVQRLGGAQGLVGGAVASGDVQLGDLAAAAGAAAGPVPVELLLQPPASLAFCTAGGGKAGGGLQQGRAEARILGAASLSGVLDCRACVHRREPAAAAVQGLCADVRRSLQARLDALLDAAEQEQEAAAAELEQQQRQARAAGGAIGGAAAAAAPPPHPLFATAGAPGKLVAVALPRRAFVASSAAGGLPFCDYLFEGESSQAMLGRLQMLLPWPQLAGAAVECLEAAAPPGAAARPGSAGGFARGGAGGSGGSGRAAVLPCMLVTAGSVAAAALALAVGYMSLQ
ncbi:odr-4-like protein isoform X1 [Micractinium conductrix]|uniref:Odr-4-like protein isoform X1 n=1 Tax=Micractinium conductrix TaxID=554055 RepID=A0A2P6VGR5_9CHLO|nr:odr-4-like protein isoform X1 [Micractinium conductrix]|eukprot:PSC73285.1 odr-4-like protein isoform X1 [Micractinium conductrix]